MIKKQKKFQKMTRRLIGKKIIKLTLFCDKKISMKMDYLKKNSKNTIIHN